VSNVNVRNTTGVDVSEFKEFGRALRKASRSTAKELRLSLVKSGEIVAQAARERIEPYSKTVADSIRVRTAGSVVYVVAGDDENPLAILLELGNAGSRSRRSGMGTEGDTFNHPVYGNDEVWVKQAMHPFLGPAAEETAPKTQTLVAEALEIALASANLPLD
jgi:hypothetical protein